MPERINRKITYEEPVAFSIEIAAQEIESILEGRYLLSKRAVALLLLQDDEEITSLVKEKEHDRFKEIESIIKKAKSHYSHPLNYVIAMRRQQEVNQIIRRTVESVDEKKISFEERLSRITMAPLTGIPILVLVIYFGLYKFVGGFGAGEVVDFLERVVFEEHINPFFIGLFSKIIPWEIMRSLFVGEYGIITLGVRYAVAIILPIVTFFFLIFSVIEDTGYLPRLAMLIDRIFKKIGLSGRAVIPMTLGFGCDTMATMVTRTLPTKRERIISTILLALAVPCSAQLGVIIALLEGRELGLLIWAIVIAAVFLFIGYLSAKILPGERPTFYMEIPPLRLPKISNILVKTYSRVEWYFKEVLPLFILGSVLIWLGKVTKFFDIAINILKVPVRLIGLPEEAAKVFLFGFFRRDYGAAGLYDLNKTGALTGIQLVVACIALTLFLPCIAQLLMNIKERGIKTGIGISIFILFFSFSVAFIVNQFLIALGVRI